MPSKQALRARARVRGLFRGLILLLSLAVGIPTPLAEAGTRSRRHAPYETGDGSSGVDTSERKKPKKGRKKARKKKKGLSKDARKGKKSGARVRKAREARAKKARLAVAQPTTHFRLSYLVTLLSPAVHNRVGHEPGGYDGAGAGIGSSDFSPAPWSLVGVAGEWAWRPDAKKTFGLAVGTRYRAGPGYRSLTDYEITMEPGLGDYPYVEVTSSAWAAGLYIEARTSPAYRLPGSLGIEIGAGLDLDWSHIDVRAARKGGGGPDETLYSAKSDLGVASLRSSVVVSSGAGRGWGWNLGFGVGVPIAEFGSSTTVSQQEGAGTGNFSEELPRSIDHRKGPVFIDLSLGVSFGR